MPAPTLTALRHHRATPWAMLGLVYLGQGMAAAYEIVYSYNYMRSRSVGHATVGLVRASALLPFAVFKYPMGLLVDRHSLCGRGHRVPYIVFGLAVGVACTAVLALQAAAWTAASDGVADHGAIALYSLITFVMWTASCLVDAAADALSVDLTPPAWEGVVQGLLGGARGLGILAGTLVLSAVTSAGASDWRSGFLSLGCLPLVACALALACPDAPPRRSAAAATAKPGPGPPRPAAVRREMVPLAFFGGALSWGYQLGLTAVPPFCNERLQIAEETRVTTIMSTAIFTFVVGVVLFGAVLRRVGYRAMLPAAPALVAAGGALLCTAHGVGQVLVALVVASFGGGAAWCGVLGSATVLAKGDDAGTVLAFVTSSTHVLGVVATACGGALIAGVGYRATFVLAGGGAALGALAIPKILADIGGAAGAAAAAEDEVELKGIGNGAMGATKALH